MYLITSHKVEEKQNLYLNKHLSKLPIIPVSWRETKVVFKSEIWTLKTEYQTVEEKQKLYLNASYFALPVNNVRCWRETKVVFKFSAGEITMLMILCWRETKVVFKFE